MRMQFRDLQRQYLALKADIDKAMSGVVTDCAYIMGPQVAELEHRLAEYVGVKHCITCANGTDALTLALKVWGIGQEDAVFVPDFTFFASAEVVMLEGATPVFVDVDQDTFNIDADDLERAIKQTKKEGSLRPCAIIAVDLFGQPANYPRLREIADKYGLKILEDGAQGFGGGINGKKACSFGDISTTSFFPAKPLGCYGDGGAVFTDNDEWAEMIDSYRIHGKGRSKYDNVRVGMNSRLDTLQAAVLLVKLKAFQKYELDAVNKVAAKYSEQFYEVVQIPVVPKGFMSSWAQYTIRLANEEQRDMMQDRLKEQGIPAMVYYPKPMHLQTAFMGIRRFSRSDLAVSSRMCRTVLSLPMHPYLTDDEIQMVAETIQKSLC